MNTLEIELTDRERQALDAMAKDAGKSPQSIVKEALEDILRDANPLDWKAAIAQAAGMWADRTDLPDFQQLRKEMDRNLWGRD